MPEPKAEPQPASLPAGSLRRHEWSRFLQGPDPELVEKLYVPALAEALRYDRCCSYFSSSVLAAAARGFAGLIQRLMEFGEKAPRPAVRLVVNEELSANDVQAMTETGDTSKLEELLLKRFKTPKDILEKHRLEMLAWLVKQGLLELRVGVMRSTGGIVHAKFGIVTDQTGDAVVFSGSGNETASGLLANYERLEISTSWQDTDRLHEYAREFEALWTDVHPAVHTVTLPEALKLKLIRLAPEEAPVTEPSTALVRQKAVMVWRFILEAPYFSNGGPTCDATAMVDMWPHQRRVVEDTSAAWPDGRLLCDEVGMGKTIEAILILRRLMAGRGVRRVLILLPAGLLKQWQSELREKGGLLFPRLEGTTTLVWPDESEERVDGLQEALKQDVLLMSRETARTENNLAFLVTAVPWDLVLLDEAHAARRRKQEEGEFNSPTLLLRLLRELQLRKRTRGIMLLSATPMQTHPWEPWDLLSVLGEGGAWLAEFSGIRNYYDSIQAVKDGKCDPDTARKSAGLIASDPSFPPAPGEPVQLSSVEAVANKLAFTPPTQRVVVSQWLRNGSPLTRRMHRSTRGTLRQYFQLGMLAKAPPDRNVSDIRFEYQDQSEQDVYDGIAQYIERRFKELETEKPGKGFVMTVYRRRASSSPQALERSLMRRRDGLLRVAEKRAFESELARRDEPEALDPDELPDVESGGQVSAALPSDAHIARKELTEVDGLLANLRSLQNKDSKRDRFFDIFRQVTEDGRSVLVFTEYSDTLEYLRENLVTHYGKSIACYSGAGGELWNGEKWQVVTKDAITRALNRGELKALICTDAASEGLNLQAAGAVINYDLPWNPSRIEQRIGRIDRIGQKHDDVRVVNLFLANGIDDKVYHVLKERCGLFKTFVGAMQPVLARARKILLGQESANLTELGNLAKQVESDPLGLGTYVESIAQQTKTFSPGVRREQIVAALKYLTGEFGVLARQKPDSQTYILSGSGFPKKKFTCAMEDLEHDQSIVPLTPHNPTLRGLIQSLLRPGERLSLVIGSHQHGAFRVTVARWVTDSKVLPVESFSKLLQLVEAWDGGFPEPEAWKKAESDAKRAAEKQVRQLEEQATQRERNMAKRQVDAARLRLQRELGRYLVCFSKSTADLNNVLYSQMSRDIATAQRLEDCRKRLGGYPEWSAELRRELDEFYRDLAPNQRQARLLGSEIDAALQDPRWAAIAD
jgi:superfamily II DNA or RNA helicase